VLQCVAVCCSVLQCTSNERCAAVVIVGVHACVCVCERVWTHLFAYTRVVFE